MRYLIAKNTIDEKIWSMVESKLNVMGNTLDNKKETLNATTVKSDIDANKTSNNKYVNLVLEKIENYEERKNRMNRRKDIRRGLEVTLDMDVRIFFILIFHGCFFFFWPPVDFLFEITCEGVVSELKERCGELITNNYCRKAMETSDPPAQMIVVMMKAMATVTEDEHSMKTWRLRATKSFLITATKSR